MTTSYTHSLRLAKQSYGSNINTWGDVIDDQFDLLDAAIAGIVQVNVNGSVTVDMTTSVLNGAVCDADNAIIRLTGTPTANATVIVPAVSKVYMIDSSTSTSTYSTLFHALGSSVVVTIGHGDKAIVYCDGSDLISLLGAGDTSNFLTKDGNLAGLTNTSAALVNLSISTPASTINRLAGWTGSSADLNEIIGLSVSAGTLNLLQGLLVSAGTLNLLLGLTVSAGVLNQLANISNLDAALLGGTAVVSCGSGDVIDIKSMTGNISNVTQHGLANGTTGSLFVTFTSAYSSVYAYIPTISFLGDTGSGGRWNVSIQTTSTCTIKLNNNGCRKFGIGILGHP